MVVSAAWLEKASGSSLFLWIEMISMRLSDLGGEKKKVCLHDAFEFVIRLGAEVI